jgi:hypothetical protein
MSAQLTDEQLRAMIQKFKRRAQSTTDEVAKEIFLEWALACEVALAEREEDRAVEDRQ